MIRITDRMLTKLITAGIAIMMLTIVAASVAWGDDDFNPPGVPTPVPIGGGGGGGGGGSGGSGGNYNLPSFNPFTFPIRSSDGTVIGRQEGKDYYTVKVSAEKGASIGNVSYVLTLEGETGQQIPDDGWLDINFETPDTAGLPEGMEGLALAKINITKKPESWNYKYGSPKYTLTISGLTEGLDAGATYYLVRLDGAGFQGQKVGIEAGTGQASLKFTPSGDAGTFILLKAAAPTPVPTQTPVATPTATPEPSNSGSSGISGLIGTFAAGGIIGMGAMMFAVNRFK